MSMWTEAQQFEKSFWGDCINTFSEELKQREYATRMELKLVRTGALGFGYDLGGKRVLDIGGGPVSMLLKCINAPYSVVADPCTFPDWVHSRYSLANIRFVTAPGERLDQLPSLGRFDEVWIYNVLQHTENPAKIISNAKEFAPVLRIFEWVDLPAYEGHPQTITVEKLDDWIGQRGSVTRYDGFNECHGRAFHGCFTHGCPNSRPRPQG